MSKSINRIDQEAASSGAVGRGGQGTAADKGPKLDESLEYTERELEYLDRYKELSGDALDDDELYDLIIKYNFDDERIRNEVKQILQYIAKKGEEYGWTKIEKGKSIIHLI